MSISIAIAPCEHAGYPLSDVAGDASATPEASDILPVIPYPWLTLHHWFTLNRQHIRWTLRVMQEARIADPDACALRDRMLAVLATLLPLLEDTLTPEVRAAITLEETRFDARLARCGPTRKRTRSTAATK